MFEGHILTETKNDTLQTSLFQALDPPTFTYPADENKLYTILMFDVDIEGRATENFIHYMVVNVPGTDAASGDVLYTVHIFPHSPLTMILTRILPSIQMEY